VHFIEYTAVATLHTISMPTALPDTTPAELLPGGRKPQPLHKRSPREATDASSYSRDRPHRPHRTKRNVRSESPSAATRSGSPTPPATPGLASVIASANRLQGVQPVQV